MAVLNPANITAHLTNYKKDINKWFGEYVNTPANWKQVAYQTTSTAAQNDYAGLMDIPSVTQWIGPRTVSNVDTQHYVVTNQDWQVSFEVSANEFNDDQSGMISERARGMPAAFERWMDRYVFTMLAQGDNAGSLGPDGVPFFAANHPVGGGTDSNINTGAAQPLWILADSRLVELFGGVIVQQRQAPYADTFGPGSEWATLQNTYLFMHTARYGFGYGAWQSMYWTDLAFTEANFWTIYEDMLTFQDANGNYINPVPDTIIFHTSLTAEVRRILMRPNSQQGLYSVDGATSTSDVVIDSVAPGVIKNFIPTPYLV